MSFPIVPSRRERVWLLVGVVVVSSMVTLHLGHRLSWPKGTELVGALVEGGNSGHLGILRNIKRLPSVDTEQNHTATTTNNNHSNNTTTIKSIDDNVSRGSRPEYNPTNIDNLTDSRNRSPTSWSFPYQHQLKTNTSSPPSSSPSLPSSSSSSSAAAAASSSPSSASNEHKKDRIKTLIAVTSLLQQIEASTLLPADVPRPLVLVDGTLSAVKQHFPMMESAFNKYKMAASFRTVDDDVRRSVSGNVEPTSSSVWGPGSWSVLLCLNVTDLSGDGCVVSATRARTKEYQKVNVIPALTLSPYLSCDTAKPSPHTPTPSSSQYVTGTWYGGEIPCFKSSPSRPSPPPPPSSSPSLRSSPPPQPSSPSPPSPSPPSPSLQSSPPPPPSSSPLSPSPSLRSSPSPPSPLRPNTDRERCKASSGSWLMQTTAGGKTVGHFIPCDNNTQQGWPPISPEVTWVEVPLPPDLLTLRTSAQGRPLLWQVTVLMTSSSPLRAYLHPSGLVWDGWEAYAHRKLPKKATLLDLHQLVSDLDTGDRAIQSLSWLENTLRDALLFLASHSDRVQSSFSRNFQLLEAVVVFNSTFHPFLIQMTPTTYTDGLSSLSEYLEQQTALEDLAAMLGSRVTVAKDVARVLTHLGLADLHTRNAPLCLASSDDFCLSRRDLVYLMDTRREYVSCKNWRRLCPSNSVSCYPKTLPTTQSINRDSRIQRGSPSAYPSPSYRSHSSSTSPSSKLMSWPPSPPPPSSSSSLSSSSSSSNSSSSTSNSSSSSSSSPWSSPQHLNTRMFYRLMEAVESVFQDRPQDVDGGGRGTVTTSDGGRVGAGGGARLPVSQDRTQGERKDTQPHNAFRHSNIPLPRACDNDPSSLPYLSAIHTHPHLQLQPEFSPLTTEYFTHVSYHRLLVSIQPVAKHCQATASLEDRTPGSDRWLNVTLGVGENVAQIAVVQWDHTSHGKVHKRWTVLNTYRIRMYREARDSHLGEFDVARTRHQVCGLWQDCSLPYASTVPCGLQPLTGMKSWSHFLKVKDALPQCTHYDEGLWMVPCVNCSDTESCYWRDAVWGSDTCQETRLGAEEVKECFRNKKLLFIGDSTLRGMSHYLMEAINGSLGVWDQTHTIKVYHSLNEPHTTTTNTTTTTSTSVGFAYYPQFWLPKHERPSLGVAFRKLLERMSPLSNSSQTVVALGGVHWLSRRHIHVLTDILDSEGLSGIRVVIKGLGAGFHQPVTSLHHLTPSQHIKLLSHNQAVLSFAVSKSFQVVDTFNMTMSRYKDFLQGKCACHFQRVSRERASIWSSLSQQMTSDSGPRYHVEGGVGRAYSEMMMYRMCEGGG